MTLARVAAPLRFALPALLALSWPALSAPPPAAATDAAVVTAPAVIPPMPAPVAVAIPAPAPPPSEPRIALVLPLDSPEFGRAASAVRDGFVAAAAAASVKPTVIAHGDGGVQQAFTKARAAGAQVIVGPLLRDDVRWVTLTTDPLPWTIALNQFDDAAPVSDHVVALALSVESEARQIARRALADGAQTIAVVASDAPLSKRFAAAFRGEWILQGGGAPVDLYFDRPPELLSALKTEINKRRADAVVLALDARDAAIAKPYLGQLPVYAGSAVNDRVSIASMRDLDDVRFVEIPWLAEPDARAFAGIARPDYASTVLERLYALGIDAFRVARAFVDGAPQKLEFDGAIGHLSLEGDRQFSRDGALMQFRSGSIVPLDSR
jgi:outer membrane PBP1 activator LpoA protein